MTEIIVIACLISCAFTFFINRRLWKLSKEIAKSIERNLEECRNLRLKALKKEIADKFEIKEEI